MGLEVGPTTLWASRIPKLAEGLHAMLNVNDVYAYSISQCFLPADIDYLLILVAECTSLAQSPRLGNQLKIPQEAVRSR